MEVDSINVVGAASARHEPVFCMIELQDMYATFFN